MCVVDSCTVPYLGPCINGEPVIKELLPPEPLDLFPEGIEKDKREKMKLASSDAVSEKGSDFQAYAIKTGQLCSTLYVQHSGESVELRLSVPGYWAVIVVEL